MSNTTDFKVKNGLSVGTSITAIGSLTTAGQTFQLQMVAPDNI